MHVLSPTPSLSITVPTLNSRSPAKLVLTSAAFELYQPSGFNKVFPQTQSLSLLAARRQQAAIIRSTASVSPNVSEPSLDIDSEKVNEAIDVLQQAAGTRTAAAPSVFEALRRLEVRAGRLQKVKAAGEGEGEGEGKEKSSDSKEFARGFPATPDAWKAVIGGTESPGRTWRLVFTASVKELRKALKGEPGTGSYFPIVAVQRFDAEAMEIENGVFFGPLGYLTFRGPFGLTGRRLAFNFHTLTLKLGPLPPFQFNIGKEEDKGRVPGEGKAGSKDPFFIFFYADEAVIAARGKGGGSAFWTRYEGMYKA